MQEKRGKCGGSADTKWWTRPLGALGSRSDQGYWVQVGALCSSHSDWWPLRHSLSALASLTPPSSSSGVHPRPPPVSPAASCCSFKPLFSSVLRQMESLITFYRLGWVQRAINIPACHSGQPACAAPAPPPPAARTRGLGCHPGPSPLMEGPERSQRCRRTRLLQTGRRVGIQRMESRWKEEERKGWGGEEEEGQETRKGRRESRRQAPTCWEGAS